MLESVFILSLGITFVLIMFIVYHFKQRLTILENKCDTMFELINSVVSELGVIRPYPGVESGQIHSSGVSPAMIKIHHDEEEVENNSDIDSDDVDTENADADASMSEEDTDNDEEDTDNDEEDTDNEEDKEVNETQDGSNIVRIVNLDNLPDLDISDTVNGLNPDDNTVDDFNEDTGMQDVVVNNIEIHVEKLSTDDVHLDEVSVASSTTDSKHHLYVYKKMTLPVLKAFVIEKGLISDPSKLKKQELLDLIQSSDI